VDELKYYSKVVDMEVINKILRFFSGYKKMMDVIEKVDDAKVEWYEREYVM